MSGNPKKTSLNYGQRKKNTYTMQTVFLFPKKIMHHSFIKF